MRYFKDKQNQFFAVEAGQEHIIKSTWVEVSKADVDAGTAPTAEQLKQSRINELKALLFASDFKVLPDYDQPNEDIKAQRQAWRNELRSLGG